MFFTYAFNDTYLSTFYLGMLCLYGDIFRTAIELCLYIIYAQRIECIYCVKSLAYWSLLHVLAPKVYEGMANIWMKICGRFCGHCTLCSEVVFVNRWHHSQYLCLFIWPNGICIDSVVNFAANLCVPKLNLYNITKYLKVN